MTTHRPLDDFDLIARVATAIVADEIRNERNRAAEEYRPGNRILFSITGFADALICRIARRLDEAALGAKVGVHSALATDDLPNHLQVDLTTTEWRAWDRHDAVIFATPEEEFSAVGSSGADIYRLDNDRLEQSPQLWITQSGLNADVEIQAYFSRAIEGLLATEADIVLEPTMLARFVNAITERVANGSTPDMAIQNSLFTLRIPNFAAELPRITTAKSSAVVFRKAFDRAAKQTGDKKFLRNHNGKPLARAALVEQIDQLLTDAKVSAEEAEVLRNFATDTEIQQGNWRASQAAMCLLPWPTTDLIFAESSGKRKGALGRETLDFFDLEFPNRLKPEERDLLEEMKSSDNTAATEEEREFFFTHQETMRDEPEAKAIYQRWERRVYGVVDDHDDLLIAILRATEQLLAPYTASNADSLPPRPHLLVRLRDGDRASMWRRLKNTRLYTYLFTRYRGLSELLAPHATIDFGQQFTFKAKEDANDGQAVTKSTKEALTFQFEASLVDAEIMTLPMDKREAARKDAPTVKFVWSISPQCLATQLHDDLKALRGADEPAARIMWAKFARKPTTGRAPGAVDPRQATSILDVNSGSEGRLVDVADPQADIGARTHAVLHELVHDHSLAAAAADQVGHAFEAFRERYTVAIDSLVGETGAGIADAALVEQAQLYGELLSRVRRLAAPAQAQRRLWRHLVRVGIAFDLQSAIVTPWQPFRLAEMHIKGRRLGALLAQLLGGNSCQMANAKTFFDLQARILTAPFYPQVCIHFDHQGKAELLAEVDTFAHYSLFERPMRRDLDDDAAADELDLEAGAAADSFLKVADDYLTLQPHEMASFSLVALNAESRALPGALAKRLTRQIEKNPALRCELMLTHHNIHRLRQIYAQQNVEATRDEHAALASENAQTFLSRLRVGFVDVNVQANGDGGAKIADLVLMQDVLGSFAVVGWTKIDAPGFWPDLLTYEPVTGSRRRPHVKGAIDTSVYLTAPRLPAPMQSYVDMLYALMNPDNADTPDHYLPARQIFYEEGRVKQLLERAHAIGDWVVNYDSIADPRLLQESDIKVIRYISRPQGGPATIVSTSTPGRGLRRKLIGEIRRVMPNADEATLEQLAECVLEEAIALSGQVVMRAARFEQFALEMIGLVLTKREVETLFPVGTPICWLFLDDVAGWLGHNEGKVADLLAVGPITENDKTSLRMVVAESKFVGQANANEEAKSSRQQLDQTYRNLRRSFVSQPAPLDRDVWNGRIADLFLEHTRASASRAEGAFVHPDIAELARDVRAGKLTVELVGVSTIFVHDDASDREPQIASIDEDSARQHVYGRAQIVNFLRRLLSDHQDRDESFSDLVFRSSADLGSRRAPQTAQQQDDRTQETADDSADPGNAAMAGTTEHRPSSEEPTAVAPRPGPEIETETEEAHHEERRGSDATTSPIPPATNAAAPPSGRLPPDLEAFIAQQPDNLVEPDDQRWLDQTVARLRRALAKYDLDNDLAAPPRLTPNGALVRFAGSDRMTVERFARIKDRLLTNNSIRINVVSIMPAVGEIRALIAREPRKTLSMTSLMKERALPATAPHQNTHLMIGQREDDGAIVYLNLEGDFGGFVEHGPHTLIAGGTGSGKGVLVQNILFDLIATNSPKNARIRLIDPKLGADYAWVREAPHLDGDIVRHQSDAATAMRELVDEMERRYAHITESGFVNIKEYNRARPPQDRLPRIFMIQDEIADWMADTSNTEFRDMMTGEATRLASKGRAAGIHLFMITQNPVVQTVPTQIKSNLTNRLCLKVRTGTNSSVVIDQTGAEKLLGRGHLAAILDNERPGPEHSYMLAQVPYAATETLQQMARLVIDFWNRQAGA